MVSVVYVIDNMHCGGTEKQLALLLKRLDRSRISPHLICLNSFGTFFSKEKLNVPVLELGCRRIFSLKGLRSVATLVSYLKKQNIDVVHTFFQDSMYLGVLAGWFAQVKAIVSSRRDLGFWRNLKDALLHKISNIFVSRVTVNSVAIKDHVVSVEKLKPEKVEIIYNGYESFLSDVAINDARDKKRKELLLDEECIAVGIVSNLNRPVKRVDLFIDMIGKLSHSEAGIRYRFFIVGDGSLRPALEERVRTVGGEQRTVFMGRISEPIDVMCAFDIAVNTSETEGFSNALIEAMVCNVPVVATDNPGNNELLGAGEYGVLSESTAEDLASSVAYLANCKEERLRLSGVAKRVVLAQYSSKAMIDTYMTLYNSLI